MLWLSANIYSGVQANNITSSMSGVIMSQILKKSPHSGEPEDIQPLVPTGSMKTCV